MGGIWADCGGSVKLRAVRLASPPIRVSAFERPACRLSVSAVGALTPDITSRPWALGTKVSYLIRSPGSKSEGLSPKG